MGDWLVIVEYRVQGQYGCSEVSEGFAKALSPLTATIGGGTQSHEVVGLTVRRVEQRDG